LEGVGVNLREAMAAYTNAASAQDYYDDRGDAQRADTAAEHLRHWGRVVDAQLAVAEAAIAYMEHQAASVGDPVVNEAVYYRERCELWNAFMAARDKARKSNQS
jgi:hypothetical protein